MPKLGPDTAVVTGLGLVTSLGRGVDETWGALAAGKVGVRSWTDLGDYPIDRAYRVAEGTPDGRARGAWLGALAADEALRTAGVDGDQRDGVDCYVGTTMGESEVFERAASDPTVDLTDGLGCSITRRVTTAVGVGGAQRTYGTACAAGNYAIGAAAGSIRSGRADVVLAGGVEPFSRIAQLGFARMRAMAPDVCRPFGADRSGMQMGEAAAFLVVERASSARRRGAEPLARVLGFGASGDSYHPTRPRADGSGMASAMSSAMAAANIQPEDVDWICAHGTGTQLSDAAEARAVHLAFGVSRPPISSLKGALGHSMGAATAAEAAISVIALHERVIPGTITTGEPDRTLDMDVAVEHRDAPHLNVILSCGYAFGGLNSGLVLGRVA